MRGRVVEDVELKIGKYIEVEQILTDNDEDRSEKVRLSLETCNGSRNKSWNRKRSTSDHQLKIDTECKRISKYSIWS